MVFLNPAILWGLLALSIPIIIHLFHFRRYKKVYFPNTRFLEEVQEQTKNRTRLRNLLVLLCRLLAFAFLILAFAQPSIPTNDGITTEDKAVSVFVDNSFSMDARGQDVPLLDEAKEMARDLIRSFPETYEFQILTHDFEGRHQRLYGRDEVLALLDEVEISSNVKTLTDVLARQRQSLSQSIHQTRASYLISDFQKSITDLSGYADTTMDVTLIPLRPVSAENLSIDSIWFDQPVQIPDVASTLYVEVGNKSERDKDQVRLTLQYGNDRRPLGTMDIPAGGSAVDTVIINPDQAGWQSAQILLEDYPVQFDDEYYFTFNVSDELNILVIYEGASESTYDAAFSGSDFTRVDQTGVRNLDYSRFPSYNLIILHELPTISSGLSTELNKYVNAGGNVMVFPDKDADINAYNAFLKEMNANELQEWTDDELKVGTINVEEFVFSDVFTRITNNVELPVLNGYFVMSSNASRGEEPLMQSRSGRTYIGKYNAGSGNLYLSISPLDEAYSNLKSNGEILVPMLHKMALASTQRYKNAYTIGKSTGILTPASRVKDPIYRVEGPSVFIPSSFRTGNQMLLKLDDEIKDAGIYKLTNNDTLLAMLAFNYNRLESNLASYTTGELRDLIPANIQIVNNAQNIEMASFASLENRGRQLWRWCIIFALVFLLFEQLLLRYFKT